MRALLLGRRGGLLRRPQRPQVNLPLTASGLAYTLGVAAPDLRLSSGGSTLALSALGASTTALGFPSGTVVGSGVIGTGTVGGNPQGGSTVSLLMRIALAASGQTPGTSGTALLNVRATQGLSGVGSAFASGVATLATRFTTSASAQSNSLGVANMQIVSGSRTQDDFSARSLDTSKWQVTAPTEGSGGGLAFTTTSMIDLVTSNIGGYRGTGSVFLTERITPSASTADSDIVVQWTVPQQYGGTFHIWSRNPTVGDATKGYDVFADTGNGDLAAYRSPGGGADGVQLFRSANGTYSTDAGTVWKMRLLVRTVGTNQNRVAGKLWPAANAEPSAWAFDVTDNVSGFDTGYTSISGSPGNDAVNMTFKVDSITIKNPTAVASTSLPLSAIGTSLSSGAAALTVGAKSTSVDIANLWRAPQQVDNYLNDYPELAPIAVQPQGRWCTEGITKANVQDWTSQASGKTMLLVIYAIPGRDNGQYSAGGFSNRAAYLSWCSGVRDGVGTAPVIFIIEPDALGLSDNISDSSTRAERIETLRQAVNIFAAAPNAEVYIDASMWISQSRQVQLLQSVDVAKVSGFTLNTSGYHTADDCYSYGDALVGNLSNAGIGSKRYTFDSGRGGNGELTSAYGSVGQPWLDANVPWCNPPGRAIGVKPGAVSGHPSCRAALWVKNPGESDGTFPTLSQSTYYGASAPNAGVFWVPLARTLLGLSAQPNSGSATPSSGFGSVKANFASDFGSMTDKTGGVTLVSGRARIPANGNYENLSSPGSYTLKESAIYAQVFAPANTGAGTSIVQFQIRAVGQPDGTRINCEINTVSGKLTIANDSGYYDANAVQITYDASAHAYLRWRETGGSVYFDTSPDKSTWTTRRSFSTPSWLTSSANQIAQFVAYKDAGASAYAEIDNVNT